MAHKPTPTDEERLRRVIELCDGVAAAIDNMSFDAFAGNDILRDAIAYRLAAIGEECKKLSDAVRAEHDLPWKQIAGMRDRLAHDYFGNVAEIIFATASADLPTLRKACAISLKKRGDQT
jgi:uncharacterized protein with HEPN domain